jgi:hypothetical protein
LIVILALIIVAAAAIVGVAGVAGNGGRRNWARTREEACDDN